MKFKINTEVLKKSILKSGLTIGKIAEKAGIHRATIHTILRENRTFSSSTVGRLARALDLEVEDIIAKTEA